MKEGKYLLKSDKITIEPVNEDDLWEGDWEIRLKDSTRAKIGTVSYAGEKEAGAIPIRIEIAEKYRNQGYGTEALKMMVDWAFLHRNIYEVTAVAEHENSAFIYSLEKAGFVFRDGTRSTEYYSITKEKSSWMGLYLMIGIVVGLIIGVVLVSPYVGMGIGLLISLGCGAAMDNRAKKEREAVVGQRTLGDPKSWGNREEFYKKMEERENQEALFQKLND